MKEGETHRGAMARALPCRASAPFDRKSENAPGAEQFSSLAARSMRRCVERCPENEQPDHDQAHRRRQHWPRTSHEDGPLRLELRVDHRSVRARRMAGHDGLGGATQEESRERRGGVSRRDVGRAVDLVSERDVRHPVVRLARRRWLTQEETIVAVVAGQDAVRWAL